MKRGHIDIGVNHVSGEELWASRDKPINFSDHLRLHHHHKEMSTRGRGRKRERKAERKEEKNGGFIGGGRWGGAAEEPTPPPKLVDVPPTRSQKPLPTISRHPSARLPATTSRTDHAATRRTRRLYIAPTAAVIGEDLVAAGPDLPLPANVASPPPPPRRIVEAPLPPS